MGRDEAGHWNPWVVNPPPKLRRSTEQSGQSARQEGDKQHLKYSLRLLVFTRLGNARVQGALALRAEKAAFSTAFVPTKKKKF